MTEPRVRRVVTTYTFWVYLPEDDLAADDVMDRVGDDVLVAIEEVTGVVGGSVRGKSWDSSDDVQQEEV